ncbi:MAG: MFS transporter [Caldibacillus sp.]
MLQTYLKQERSWMLYDLANSAFSIIVSTAIFPIYFKSVAESAGVSSVDGTAYYGYAVSLATFILALLGPVLGTIADYKGMKKKFFVFFFALGVLGTASLALPFASWVLLAVFYVIATVGSSGANIFYNSFLTDVTEEKRFDEVSAKGFAVGYIGSVIPFVAAIAVIFLTQAGIIPLSVGAASQIAFLITALWWGLFTIPFLKNVKQVYYVEREGQIILGSFKRLWQTFKDIRQYRNILIFLIAYFFYIDGVGTIINMSTAYGTDVGLDATGLLVALLVVQIVAAPFAVLFGKLARKFGRKNMLYVAILVYTFVCIFALFLDTLIEFWFLALMVGTVQGGIQAISRSFYASMVPKDKSNEFFGFYNIFGKFASVLGPFLLAVTTQLTGSSTYGVFSIIILFIIGFVVLLFVKEEKTEEATS